uniref:Aminopeptidase P family protein n=1 Tax=Caldimicrobium thiodismutans TaxID=1653476 RepID=A0A832GRT8_9BACT
MQEDWARKRLLKVRKLLEERGLSALLFASQASVFYLTKFRASHAYFLVTEKEAYLLTDARYIERAKQSASSLYKVELILGDPFKFLKNFLKTHEFKRVGYESERVTCGMLRELKSKHYKLIPLMQPLKELRMIKGSEEREFIKEAVKIVDRIYLELLDYLRPGLTELEVRGKILELAFRYGGEGEAFPSIVASGENSAIPHWETSRKPLEANKPLLIDMGIVWEGYCSDFTRTLYLGRASEDFKKYYQLVKEAWFRGFERAKVGTPVYEIDRAIREFFQEKGVISHFTHATGHGIGIEIHEPPRIYFQKSKRYLQSQPLLEEGMVFTIEPGLYFPGNFGIRLENVVFIEGGEAKVYSDVSLELVEL